MENNNKMDQNKMNKDKKLDYPKIGPFKSNLNMIRQDLLKRAMQWLQHKTLSHEENPYLKGIFAPVEETHSTKLTIKGSIPPQLNGQLLRIGPNPIHVKNPELYHWFAGDGMLHSLQISAGQASTYQCRYIETDSVQQSRQQPPVKGFRRGPGDVVNTNVYSYAGRIWASIEAGAFPVCLDAELNTLKHSLFDTDADLPFTAHPHRATDTGHLHAVCYDAFDQKHVYYEVFDTAGQLIHLSKIPVQHGPMVHDCAITDRDILIFDFPVTFSVMQVFKGSSLPYIWNPKHPARIGVLPLYGEASQIQWIALDPCFVFHAANAYRDDKDQIIVDVVVHEKMFEQSHQGPFEQQQAQLERWRIKPDSGTLQRFLLDAQAQEFPRIDERRTGHVYRYLYSVSFDTQNMQKPNHLLIMDLQTQQKTRYVYGAEWISGEVIFIAESDDSPEGVGYLLSYVHHLQGKASKVVILKANGLNVSLQAEIDLGVRVPIGFHTNWVDLN